MVDGVVDRKLIEIDCLVFRWPGDSYVDRHFPATLEFLELWPLLMLQSYL